MNPKKLAVLRDRRDYVRLMMQKWKRIEDEPSKDSAFRAIT